MKLIPLTQGRFAMVDDEDFEELNKHKWYAHQAARDYFQAARNAPGAKRGTVLMHRILVGALRGQQVDHKDGNPLNNQRANLRLLAAGVADLEQWHSFKRKALGCSSAFRGVAWRIDLSKWQAYITHNGRRYHLGYFTDEESAAKAFDSKARELGWPEYGLNFPIK